MLTHRVATQLPAISGSELQQFISTPDEKQLIDIHAWALAKALSDTSGGKSAGGTPTSSAGGTPTSSAGGTPTSSAGGTPTSSTGGTPSRSAGGTPTRSAGGTPSRSAGGTPSSAASAASTASDSYERLRLLVALRDEAGGEIYFADGHSYARDALECEFPEFKLFNIGLDEAFTESICPGVWVETPQFATLRSLSAMRREIRRTGLHPSAAAVDIMRALLGL
jgi:hypothetical protein